MHQYDPFMKRVKWPWLCLTFHIVALSVRDQWRCALSLRQCLFSVPAPYTALLLSWSRMELLFFSGMLHFLEDTGCTPLLLLSHHCRLRGHLLLVYLWSEDLHSPFCPVYPYTRIYRGSFLSGPFPNVYESDRAPAPYRSTAGRQSESVHEVSCSRAGRQSERAPNQSWFRVHSQSMSAHWAAPERT